MDFIIRQARLDDREAIEHLIRASARGLSRAEYSDQQIEAAIATVFGVDTALIHDGTYFVAEGDGELVGCGGWSKRRKLYGGDQVAVRDSTELDPNTEAAKIRAFFIHPEWSRKGIARAILARCETEAMASGFRALELMATLPGVKFYQACGYHGDESIEYDMKDGVTLGLLPMRKQLV